jgi:putative ABC transport system substrate-binding protein
MTKRRRFLFLLRLNFCSVPFEFAIRNSQSGILAGALLFALCSSAEAQQPAKTYRIGYISSGRGIEVREEAFRQGLRELGYVEGQNLVIEWRFAKGQVRQRPEIAVELVRLNVDCIVAAGSGETTIAQKATSAIPIVMMSSTDPVGTGFVVSLARPGGNITGLTSISGDLGGKALELLKEIVPTLSRVVAPEPAGGVSQDLFFKETEIPARALRVKVIRFPVRGPEDFEEIFRTATRERAGGLLNRLPPSTPSAQRKLFADLAAKSRLPAIFTEGLWATAGGLMSYGPDRHAMDRRAAHYVDKILKGSKPAELPVEQPTKFELVINLKAAKQIGLTIPQSLLYRADRVIK